MTAMHIHKSNKMLKIYMIINNPICKHKSRKIKGRGLVHNFNGCNLRA